MATPKEKLAKSLKSLKKHQDKGHIAIKTSELSRTDRERLTENGFINEAIQGWYIITAPEEVIWNSTSWYTSYWKFCERYLSDRYNSSYCISAEQSLLLHAENWTVPSQLIIRAIKGTNSKTLLPHGTSLFTMKSPLPNKAEIILNNGIRMLSLASSLVNCTESTFKIKPTDTRAVLAKIKDSSEVLRILLEGGHTVVAGRLAGAFRNIGQEKIADDIVKAMKSAGYDIRESDPFNERTDVELLLRVPSPNVNRIRLMWNEMRNVVIDNFPEAPGIPKNQEKYLAEVNKLYVTDAYHSLSIERYRVSPELIERVSGGEWTPDENEQDIQEKDAMAARGYWQATQKVIESVFKVLKGESPGNVVDNDHGDWYRELFAPSIAAGILKPADLAGYRNDQVYIGKSKHVPPNANVVRDSMPEFFRLLIEEEHSAVKAILGHFVFVYIHPYMDGNGRMARFLMNVMLTSGGFPWTVIPVEERDNYMNSLELASVNRDITEFTKFVAHLVSASIKGKPVAKVDK